MKKLPKNVLLPGGFKITISLVDDLKMAELIGQEYDAVWFDREATIYIRKDLPLPTQWYMLSHEMLHAVADWQHKLIRSGVARP